MRIIVASTPKTGNTWMTHLLSAIYDLREVELPLAFDPVITNSMGSNWVSLQHYYPDPVILAWARRHQGTIVTTVRHPGDLLVSLRHMILNESYDPNADLRRLSWLVADDDEMGSMAVKYVSENFYHGLYISMMWMKSGESFAVRYEDLWRDPVTTLTELTNKIRPVSRDRIESAIDLCDIKLLRKLYSDPKGEFFRKGGPGSWREELPEQIVDIFRNLEPYPSLFRTMGYTLDPHDPLIDAPAKSRASTNPFLAENSFDNGARVSPIIVRLYLLLDSGMKDRWRGSETATSEGSFFAWLNARADEDPYGQDGAPLISNLAYYVYRIRHDIQQIMPDVLGGDRNVYIAWFLNNAKEEYELDAVFLKPMRDDVRAKEIDLSQAKAPANPPDPATPAQQAAPIVAQAQQVPAGVPPESPWPGGLGSVRATAKVNPHLPIAWPTWPKGVWPKIEALAQKVVRRLLRWYIEPIVEQQNRFNQAVAQALEEMWQEIAEPQKPTVPEQPEKSSKNE